MNPLFNEKGDFMIVRNATLDDVSKVTSISEENKLTDYENQKKSGFLVSNFDKKYYYHLVQEDFYFKVVEVNEDIKGFMFGYLKNHLDENKRVDQYFLGLEEDVFILKQVCVTKHAQGMGIGRKLYTELFHDMHKDIYLAVVSEPRNIGSEKFHSKLGFEKVTEIEEVDGLGRTIYRRRVVNEG